MQLIQVLYRKDTRGSVDDITLDELIRSQKISRFYRPSEDRWVDIGTDDIRRSESPHRGPERRVSHRKEDKQEEDNPRGLFVRLLRRKKKLAPPKELTSGEWFQQGFLMLHKAGDYLGATRAFAKAIQLDPANQRAFLTRGIVYEWIGNGQQAIEDYSRAIQLAPDDAKVYYARGLVLRRLGRETEAIADLKRAADLRYRPAIDVLRPLGIIP
jgi:predicted Zn-dependent protease